jgi:hypothetical protein
VFIIPLVIISWVGWARSDRNYERANAEAVKAAKAAEDEGTARADAEQATADLARQERLVRTIQIVRTLAEIGAATTDAELAVASNRWVALSEQVRKEEAGKPAGQRYFTDFLDNQFPSTPDRDGLVAAATAAKERADVAARATNAARPELKESAPQRQAHWYATTEWNAFRGPLALKVARDFRNDLLDEHDDRVTEGLNSVRRVAFERVRLCVDEMVRTFEDKPFDAAAPLVREFWLNYWGELGLVEGQAVTGAMVDFGKRLRQIEERLPEFAAADRFYSFNRNVKERKLANAPRPDSILNLAPGKWEEANRLFRDYSRMVFPDERKDLKTLAEALKEALKTEQVGPIRPYGQSE